jgi:hypothetical protein
MKVRTEDFGSSRPKLEPNDIEEAAIVTVAGYEQGEVDDPERDSGKRITGCVWFEETGDKVIWLNKGMMDTLVEKLGDETDHWVGKQIPIERHTATYGNKKFPKVHIIPAEGWDKAFREAGITKGRSVKKPRKVKRGR